MRELAPYGQLRTRNFAELEGRGYEVVLLDPPWAYYGDPSKDQAAGKHYALMTNAELKSLPLPKILAKTAVVFCWATAPLLDRPFDLFAHWGLHYRGVFQVWVKTRQDGGWISGQGVRPSFTKPTAEYLLVFATMAKGRPFPLLTEAMANVVPHVRPGSVHSRKPQVFARNVVRLLGSRPRVELFCRNPQTGWDAWGNEVAV